MKRGKYLLLTVTAAALLAAIPFQAFASKDTEDRSPVGSIGLNVSSMSVMRVQMWMFRSISVTAIFPMLM